MVKVERETETPEENSIVFPKAVAYDSIAVSLSDLR